jgi:ubiquinone/menaquinone biosynthesis C-methylase UbiE
MSRPKTDAVFKGSVPEIYDEYLVPLIFESYADDLVERLCNLADGRVLELAAGTGVVTRGLARRLPSSVEIVGSDLNQAMLDRAAAVGTSRDVCWRRADALELPFNDGSFDAVLCQFGVMFFPDKARAYGEAHRVLRPGGRFIFNVWDHIGENEFADVVTRAVGTLFPDDPPQFLARTPYGYFNQEEIRRHLAVAGFDAVEIAQIEAQSWAALAADPAIAYCHGTPLRDEIEARDPSRLGEATEVATAAIERRFGAVNIEGKIRGFVVTANS